MCVNVVNAVVVLMVLMQTCADGEPIAKGPPKVEGKPNLLDSFIPASMQIMAHVTELMKYDLKPTTSPPYGIGSTTRPTIPPTPSHRPGVFAPAKPPGPEEYFSQKGFNYRDYVERLQQPSGYNYFDRYSYPINGEEIPHSSPFSRDSQSRSYSDLYRETNGMPVDYETYFGKEFADVLKLVNRVEPEVVSNDVDFNAQNFIREYDDSELRFELWRQKKVPPTKAYVTLLSLYDLLNKESKRLGLNKYQGYSDRVLQDLVESSTGTSAYQLRTVLNKIVERGDTKKPDIVKKMKQVITDLDEAGSYINLALRYIPPLSFVL